MSCINGERLIFPQHEGPSVELVVYGDEFYARYESVDGYTVVYDTQAGVYCYAVVLNGHFVSTGIPLHKPVPAGLLRHLKESPEVRNASFDARYKLMRGMPELPFTRTFGPADGLLRGRRVSSGVVNGLTILVQFADETTGIAKQQVAAMLNQDGYSANGNHCSVKDYFSMMSSGKLDYSNRVVGPVTLQHNKQYYETTPLMEEALQLAIAQENLNLAEFDSLGQGKVDALSFMYAGRTVYKDWLWPHNHTLDFSHQGTRTGFYTIQSLGRHAVDLSIGTFCHESGHMLCRFPDVYDYGSRDGDSEKSAGLGRYCLMSSGNHLNRGRTPAPVNAYLRHLVGWENRVVDLSSPGRYSIRQADYGVIHKFPTGQSNEYFLLESRLQSGLDLTAPDNGLAVYHCDTEGSNEWQAGTASEHYQVALLQADGHLDLENNRNSGDEGDLFVDATGTVLSHDTTVNSRTWGGAESGLVLSDVQLENDMINVTVGTITVAPGGRLIAETSPDLLIPDFKPEGVHSTLKLQGNGQIESINVSCSISHTYIGDLQVELESPDGTRVMLHDRAGGSTDDLDEAWDSSTHSGLSTLQGSAAGGTWKLHVRDLALRDSGRLNQWRLEIQHQTGAGIVEKEAQPDIAIPDNNGQGIEHGIVIDANGNCTAIRVEVEISHTFIGDLRVELVSPSGSSALLHSQTGGSASDLVASYDTNTTPALGAMLGEPVNGEWRLAVSDHAAIDTGKLESWRISLQYE